MSKPERNAPCPCGSGKKYKKCCINKEVPPLSPEAFFQHSFQKKEPSYSFIDKYDPKELLKIVALLQVQPLNHGKNIRLELLSTEIVNKIHNGGTSTNYGNLSADLRSQCTKHWAEDPPEEFFTENIVFVNGNSVVYPGIFSNCIDIVQGQLHSLLDRKKLPYAFIIQVMETTLFILHIQNSIAEQLGHKPREYEESIDHQLFVPNKDFIEQHKELFYFPEDKIRSICTTLRIPHNIIHEFKYDIAEEVSIANFDDNPLFLKPFIEVDGDYYLVMPTALLCALSNFILQKVEEHNCVDQFMKNFASEGKADIDMIFSAMGWHKVAFDFIETPQTLKSINLIEELWQFDTNKLAYVPIIVEIPSTSLSMDEMDKISEEFTDRVKAVGEAFRKRDVHGKLMMVSVLLKTSILQPFMLSVNDIQNIDQQIHFSFNDLQCLTSKWSFNNLTLWKYVKYLDLSQDRIKFTPFNSHLSKFDWYQRNNEAFNDPDKEPIDFAVFDFHMEGNVKREAKSKIDKIGIPFFSSGETGFIRCRRKEQYYPVYVSEEIRQGFYRNCLLKYLCPIWIQGAQTRDYTAEVYINAIFYWLNIGYDLLKDFINQLGSNPITVTLRLDSLLSRPDEWDIPKTSQKLNFKYSILASSRAVEIDIPVAVINQLSTVTNSGEREFMKNFIQIIGELIEEVGNGKNIAVDELDVLMDQIMPEDNRKMIIMAQRGRDLSIDTTAIRPARDIPKSDISYLLNQQVHWLNYSNKISKKITSATEKVKLLNDLVALHFKYVVELISKYEAVQFLMFLMQLHENSIHEKAFRQITYPAKEACYSSFIDVKKDFLETESALVTSNLALRTLIEFVACEMPSGHSIPNEDDTDLMLAHVSELINYGAISDTVKFGIHEPDIGLLPSGRIGISTEFTDNALNSFRNEIYLEEYEKYKTNYHEHFYDPELEPSKVKTTNEEDIYYDKIDLVFCEAWGITIWDIVGASHFIGSFIFSNDESVMLLPHEKLVELFRDKCNFSEREIAGFLKVLMFEKRNGILNVDKKDLPEVYPWRYNRRISYLLKPIIPITLNREQFYIVSARHLYSAAQNIFSRFMDGTLKVSKKDFKILNLLSERNDIKGRRFRNKVYEWLTANTSFKVISHEVKIKPRGFFSSEIDKGDIDVLAIDFAGKIIYSIECKNTSQAKVAYDIYSEITSYLGENGTDGMIEKHIKRDNWLNENKKYCCSVLNLSEDYTIKSIVITRNILPTKFIRDMKIPLFSFAELVQGLVFG